VVVVVSVSTPHAQKMTRVSFQSEAPGWRG